MFEGLTRENIDSHVVHEIGRPKAHDARVCIVEMDGHRAVLKDVRAARSLFGRRLIAREFAVYRALDGVEGVPRPYRMLDRDGFLIEYIESTRLRRRDIRRGQKVPPEVYDRCLELVARIHERGVLHFDLRNRKNFLFDEARRVYIIDFASAVRLPRWLPFRRALVRLFGTFDRAAVLKMKQKLSPELMTDAETKFINRFEWTRSILFPPALLARLWRRRRRDKE